MCKVTVKRQVQSEKKQQQKVPKADRAPAFVSPNILARAGDVVDRAKTFLTSSLITMRNLVAVM